MKTILLPVESNTTIGSAFAVADLLAATFDGQVDGVALKPSVIDFIAPDPVVVVLPQPNYSEAEIIKEARTRFDSFCQSRGAQDGSGRGKFRWSGRPAIDDTMLASVSRVYDITIVGRPGVGRSEPRMTTLEAALFESGRPIIMAPPVPPKTLGRNILVHWNASTETSRVVSDSLRLLRLAERVTLLSVEGNMVPGPEAADMISYLSAHGVKATDIHVRPESRSRAGEAILAQARRIGADLILKGAYTQSRLKQMIFGGATQYILQSADIPVILSH
jgi:nucleotide-binding universal stress UspA family protein